MKMGFYSGVVLIATVLTACSAENRGINSTADAVPQYPAAQQQFYALNKACEENYDKGQNEIQKSLAFNDCNKQRKTFAKQNGISGWTGTIKEISTDQGADVVTVDIEAEIDGFSMAFTTVNNRLSDMNTNSMIRQNNPLFNVLAQMKEGDKVTFNATFLNDPEGKRGIWEDSFTEEGSMSDPSFSVKFSDIRPFDSAPAPAQSSAPTGVEVVPAIATQDNRASAESKPVTGAMNRDFEGDNVSGAPKVGAEHEGGYFLLREEIEMYWNDWYAMPLVAKRNIPTTGEASINVIGEGKTAGFEGNLIIECGSGKYHWASVSDDAFTTAEEVPGEVTRNAVRIFCAPQ